MQQPIKDDELKYKTPSPDINSITQQSSSVRLDYLQASSMISVRDALNYVMVIISKSALTNHNKIMARARNGLRTGGEMIETIA